MFHLTSYADDTTLLAGLEQCVFNRLEIVEMEINNEIFKINNWLKANKLSVNIDKTSFMTFNTSNKYIGLPELKLKIDDKKIERVSQFDFPGITIHENLNWKYHIEKIKNKIKKALVLTKRLNNFLPCKTLLIIYNSFDNVPSYLWCKFMGPAIHLCYKTAKEGSQNCVKE